MAQVTVLKRQAAKAGPATFVEGVDQALLPQIEGTVGPRSLWADAAATSITIGGGALNAAVSIGGVAATVTVPGALVVQNNLTVNGTTTTVNTTNLTVSDALIYANNGGLADSSAGVAFDQGAEDDAVALFNGGFNAGEGRFELGRANTVGGTVTPPSLSTFSDLKISDLSLAGTTITADAGLSIDATAAPLSIGGTSATSVTLGRPGLAATVPGGLAVGAGQTIAGAGSLAITTAAGQLTLNAFNNIITTNALQINAATSLTIAAFGADTVSLRGHSTTVPLNTAGDPALDTVAQDLVGAINEAFAAASGTQTLAQTLAAGNVTGGNDLIVSDGDDLVMGSGAGAANMLWGGTSSGNIGNVAQTQSPDNIYAATSVVAGVSVAVGAALTIATSTISANGPLTITSVSNVLALSATGVGQVTIATAGTTRWAFQNGGGLLPGADGVYQLGNSTSRIGGVTSTNFVAREASPGTTNTTYSRDEIAANVPAGAFDLHVTNGPLTIRTVGAHAMTFTALGGAPIGLNEIGNLSLDGGFTATSIVGALNELFTGGGGGGGTLTYTNGEGTTLLEGEVVSPSTVAAQTVLRASATADTAAALILGFVTPVGGIASTASGDVATADGNRVSARFDAALTLALGDEVFLSTTAGRVTNDISAYVVGNVAQSIGVVTDLLGYDGAGNLLAQIQVIRGAKSVL